MQLSAILIWAILLTPEHIGIITIFSSLQEISYFAFLGWWSFYTLRFIGTHSDPQARRDFLKTETAALLGSTLASSAAFFLAAPLLGGNEAAGQDTLLLGVIFVATRSLNTFAADRARAEGRIALYSIAQMTGPIAGFGIGLLLIAAWVPDANAVLAGFIIAQVAGIVLIAAMSDMFRRVGWPVRHLLKDAIRFGGTQACSQMLAVAAMNVPRFLVLASLGLGAAGTFAVGYGLGLRASSFAVTLVTAGAYPLVVRKMNEEGARAAFAQLRRNMVLVALVTMPVALGLIAVSGSITGLFVAPEFRAVTYAVLPLATLGGLLRYVRAHTSDQVFLLNRKPQAGTLVAAADLVVAAASAFIGVALLGTAGAALGPMVSGLFTFVLSFALARHVFGFRAPLGAFARIGGAAAIMAALVWSLPLASGIPALALHIALGGAVYAGLILLVLPEARSALLRAGLQAKRP